MVSYNILIKQKTLKIQKVYNPQFVVEDDEVYLKFLLVSNDRQFKIKYEDIMYFRENE